MKVNSFLFSAILIASLSSVLVKAQSFDIETEKLSFQNPPITLETMVGSRGVMYQLIVNKKFQSIPKLGFFSVTNGTATWQKEMTPDIMTQAQITYSLFKNLDISAGMQYTPIYEYRPIAALIYSYAVKDFLFIVNPKVDLASDLATETMALIEYKPKINNTFNFYSRIQGLYGFVPESGIHNRSYIMLRAGLSYKEFSFGLSSDFDWYGPIKHNENNYGVFIGALLF